MTLPYHADHALRARTCAQKSQRRPATYENTQPTITPIVIRTPIIIVGRSQST
jgi:hypothetical protein